MRLNVSEKYEYRNILTKIAKEKLKNIYDEYRKEVEATSRQKNSLVEVERLEKFCSEEMSEIIVRCLDIIYPNIKKLEEKNTQEEIVQKLNDVVPDVLFELDKKKNLQYLQSIFMPNIKADHLYNEIERDLHKMSDIDMFLNINRLLDRVENTMDSLILPICSYNNLVTTKNVKKKIRELKVDFYNDILNEVRQVVINDVIKNKSTIEKKITSDVEMRKTINDFTENLNNMSLWINNHDTVKFLNKIYNEILEKADKFLTTIPPKEIFELIRIVQDTNITVVDKDNISKKALSHNTFFSNLLGKRDETNEGEVNLLDTDIEYINYNKTDLIIKDGEEPITVFENNEGAYNKCFEKIYINEIKEDLKEYMDRRKYYFDMDKHEKMMKKVKEKSVENLSVEQICEEKTYFTRKISCPEFFIKSNYPQIEARNFVLHYHHPNVFLRVDTGIDKFGEQTIEISIGSEKQITVKTEDILKRLEEISITINVNREDEGKYWDGIYISIDEVAKIVREFEVMSSFKDKKNNSNNKKTKI